MIRTPREEAAAVAASQVREWTDRRNARIEEARRDGATLRRLAEVTGLTHTAIAKIVGRSPESLRCTPEEQAWNEQRMREGKNPM